MKGIRFAAAAALLLSACDAAENVEVLPLPALERPSPEARLGLPEVQGVWRFAGWEVSRGDSMALERTFPSFGELRIQTQRLDSIAGAFVLAGGPARIVGDVRRNGHISLVTFGPGGPASFLAGEVGQDTLWLELTSILAPGEWPRDSRAAFVREPVAEPIAWIRGARPGDVTPPPTDSLTAMPPTGLPAGPPNVTPGVQPSPTGGGQVGQPGVQPSPRPAPAQPGAAPPSVGGAQPPVTRPPAQPTPAVPQPGAGQPSPQPGGPGAVPRPPPEEPEPEPEEPEIEIEIPEPELPPLLGDPVL